ncbi:MAG: hypothetical protein MUE60_06935 [Candidatus Eisenbacteria bacterium]|jgi:hypothetical protein|nr:hypothetical protein [Candidatus Eisenbacteria bacterium]
MDDFTFKIGLLKDEDLPPADPAVPPHVSLVREQLQTLLDVVVLTSAGGDVSPDGFRFVGESEVHSIWLSTA